MSDKLADWLAREIKTRGLSIRELARKAGVSHTTASEVIAHQRAPTWHFSNAVARALDEPPEKIFRLAGLLPPLPAPNGDPTLVEILEIAKQLTPEERHEILEYVLWRYQKRKKPREAT